jgi:predicted  nucleic acid-binding Zn-ribbon protein
MEDGCLKIVLEALAEKIDRLNGEIYCRDYEVKKLRAENEKLKKAVEYFEQALLKEGE